MSTTRDLSEYLEVLKNYVNWKLKEEDLKQIPIIPNIHQTVYNAASQPHALNMCKWHTCKTTHCRAGWVTTSAGPEGTKLERKVGPEIAAKLIYFASDPDSFEYMNFPDFYCDEKKALADMKKCAEEEKAINDAATPHL